MQVSLTTNLVDFLANIPALNLTAGVNLFDGLVPQEVTNAVMVVPAGGTAPHEYLDTESIIIDFWTVYNLTPAGYDMLKQIFELFHRKENYTLNNWYIYSSLVSGNIIDSDRTVEGAKLHKLSILFTCRPLADIS